MIVLSIGSIRQLAPSARMLLMLKRRCKIQLRQSAFSFSTPLGIAPYLVRISMVDFELSVGRYVVGGQLTKTRNTLILSAAPSHDVRVDIDEKIGCRRSYLPG